MSLKIDVNNKAFSQVPEFSDSHNHDQDNFVLNDVNIKLIDYGIPFVIRKFFPEKICKSLKELHLLSSKVNDVKLPVEYYNNLDYDTTGSFAKHLTFQEYIEYLFSLETKDTLYLVLDLHNKIRKIRDRTIENKTGSIFELLNDEILNNEILKKRLFYNMQRRVFFLGKNTITQTHYHDRQEAVLHQVVGTKRIYLFPPNKHLFYQMQPHSWYTTKNLWSQIKFKFEEFEEFEKVSEQKGLRGGFKAILEPGDSLYIPIYWWHTVFGENISMSVSDFFNSSFRKKYFSPWGIRTRFGPKANNGNKLVTVEPTT